MLQLNCLPGVRLPTLKKTQSYVDMQLISILFVEIGLFCCYWCLYPSTMHLNGIKFVVFNIWKISTATSLFGNTILQLQINVLAQMLKVGWVILERDCWYLNSVANQIHPSLQRFWSSAPQIHGCTVNMQREGDSFLRASTPAPDSDTHNNNNMSWLTRK